MNRKSAVCMRGRFLRLLQINNSTWCELVRDRLAIGCRVTALVPCSAHEIADAEQLLHQVVSRAPQGRQQPLSDNAYAWLDRMLERNGEERRQDAALWRTLAAMNRNWSAGTRVGAGATQQSFDLLQRGGVLYSANSDPQGSFLGGIHSIDNLLQTAASGFWVSGERRPAERGKRAPVRPADAGAGSLNLLDAHERIQLPDAPQLVLETDAEQLVLERGARPEWASAKGRDRYGLWAAFRIDEVGQRLRWIPPGRYLMGSPEEEAGRHENEGPRHSVIISRGFWLFDTPVTQALWTRVMGKNPSRFPSDERPVDSVSWHDSQTFIQRLNDLKPGSVQLRILG